MQTKAKDRRQTLISAAMVFGAILFFAGSSAFCQVSSVTAAEASVAAARVKVCQISADLTNIPIGTAFTFEMTGTAASGALTTYTFDVLAGPSSQGGFCAFAPDTWVSGSAVFVGEKGLSTANTTTLPLGTEATRNALRISSIVSSFTLPSSIAAAIFPSLTGLNNPEIRNPATGYVGHSVIVVTDSTTEITFTDFVYRPAALKLCNSSRGFESGATYAYTIAPADPLTTWPFSIGPFNVAANTCVFIDGPYPTSPALRGVGLFNHGSKVVVTQVGGNSLYYNYSAVSVTSSTLLGTTPLGTLNVGYKQGTLSLNQPLLPDNNFNEITFLNQFSELPPGVRVRFDFDGDIKSDVAVFRPSDGNWYYVGSSNGSTQAIHFGQAGDVPVAADYDGDGKTDVAVYRNGQWFVQGSHDGFSSANFGLATDIPQVGDYDGDGKADFAVFRPSNGTWYMMRSSAGFRAVQFGISTDLPVAADFDGDGVTDPAVYRDGTWYILGSSTGFTTTKFDTPGVPVQADYDGDRRADFGVYRNGVWYINGSVTRLRTVQFGVASDTPVPADYDGDGKTDIAVYRSSNNTWYILRSSQAGNAVGGFSSMQFGSAGDLVMRY